MAKRLTDSQRGMLNMLKSGFMVGAVHLSGPYWQADCEHLPNPKISTIRVLEREGLITHDGGAEYRTYRLTYAGHRFVTKEDSTHDDSQ